MPYKEPNVIKRSMVDDEATILRRVNGACTISLSKRDLELLSVRPLDVVEVKIKKLQNGR